ncbi:hypothetical protein PGB90_000226 [Kerria lacca]
MTGGLCGALPGPRRRLLGNPFVYGSVALAQYQCPIFREKDSLSEEFNQLFPVCSKRPLTQSYPLPKGFRNKITPSELGPIVDPPVGAGCISPDTPCNDSKYRTFSGICNNLNNPTWGSVNTPYGRLLSSKYSDGIHALPRSVINHEPLPLPRIISVNLFPELIVDDPLFTLVTMSWSQFVTHDLSLAMGTTPSETAFIRCCDENFHILPYTNPRCIPLIFPKDDEFYSNFDVTCLDLIRTITDIDTGCNPGNRPAEQLVAVTHWMDASMVYGNSNLSNHLIREEVDGKLKVELKYNKPFPPRSFNLTDFCFLTPENEPCYQTGDRRGNQNPQITSLHILMLRHHNNIASALKEVNPHWNDGKLFHESRRILIAEYQYITFYEFLPILLGYNNMLKYKLIHNTDGYTYDYDENVNPHILNEFATGAFRLFHSIIQGDFNLLKERRHVYQKKRLSDFFNRPIILEKKDNFDNILRGLSTQSQEMLDQFLTTEVTNFLFKGKNPFGADLKVVDILRSRDHAIASYNDYRQFCSLKKAQTFSDFLDVIEEENVKKLAFFYNHPDDVELIVGGSLERLVPGTLAGPTFLCLLIKQFYITRTSDRYFFEAGNQTGSFKLDQLKQIKKITLARIFCDNGDDIHNMQPKAFHKISADNPLVSCKDFKRIPTIDFKYWKEMS